jgi:hypothetical protein
MAKQGRLPGTPEGIPELEEIGVAYAAARDERMEILKREVELKAKAMECMKKHKLKDYRVESLVMQIMPGEEKLKVKILVDAE